MIEVKALITDHGDSSVGIFPMYWVIECPFYKDAPCEDKESFRESIKEVYAQFSEGRITVDFDYELKTQNHE